MEIDWLKLAINIIFLQLNVVLYVAERGTISTFNITTINITYLNDSATTLPPETASPNAGRVKATTTNSAETREKIPLYIGGIFSLGGRWDGSGILPAVEMGLDHINSRVDILPEYELRMIWNDSQVQFYSCCCSYCFFVSKGPNFVYLRIAHMLNVAI